MGDTLLSDPLFNALMPAAGILLLLLAAFMPDVLKITRRRK